MKILHIIDGAFFAVARKTISEAILALSEHGVAQEALVPEGSALGWVPSVIPVGYLRRAGILMGRITAWRTARRFGPDIVLKWGKAAREIAPPGQFVQVSFITGSENLKAFDRSDYIMANSEYALALAKARGFSGAKSFFLSPFFYDYKDAAPAAKKDLFIPEKAKIIHIAGNFERGIGWEALFESMPSLLDVYFAIAGSGPDEEFVKDYASRANLKSRSRFIPEIERSSSALALSEFALVPFSSPEAAKAILESQAAGKAVIAADVPFARELIEDGRTGFLVPMGDTYLLRRKIKDTMASGVGELGKIGKAAREAAARHSARAVMPGYISMFSDLAGRFSARRNLLD